MTMCGPFLYDEVLSTYATCWYLYGTVPKTISTRIVYGVLIGVVTVLFQRLGNTENAILYAILISNPIAISLDDNAFSFRKLWDEIVEDMKASKTKTVEKKK